MNSKARGKRSCHGTPQAEYSGDKVANNRRGAAATLLPRFCLTPRYLGGEVVEKNLVSAILQGRDGRAELGELEEHVHHPLRPSLPLVVVDRQLLAQGQTRGRRPCLGMPLKLTSFFVFSSLPSPHRSTGYSFVLLRWTTPVAFLGSLNGTKSGRWKRCKYSLFGHLDNKVRYPAHRCRRGMCAGKSGRALLP